MLKMTRRAASAAVLIIAAVVAVIPLATQAQGQTPAPPRRQPQPSPRRRRRPRRPRRAAAPHRSRRRPPRRRCEGRARARIDAGSRESLRPRSALARQRLGREGDAGHPGHHVDGHVVHHHRQALRADEAQARRPRRAHDVLARADGEAGRGDAARPTARSASSPSPGSRPRRSTTACSATST